MKLSPAKLTRFTAAAEAGDGESARQVWIHHLTVEDRPKYRIWLRKAAELGDCSSIEHWVEAIQIIGYEDFPTAELSEVQALGERASCASP